MMYKNYPEDKALNAHVKEAWEMWKLEDGSTTHFLSIDFDDFLKGYLFCYYKNAPHLIEGGIDYFDEEITKWEEEEEQDDLS